MRRINKLCGFLSRCRTFADVACDHGYAAQYMLKNGLCDSAVISDISPKCLSKAQTLLSPYIQSGKCRAVCCDGLTQIDAATELVLIAGIGGEEIVKILSQAFIPNNFVFQPMKNARTLRSFLIEKGCAITRDDIFSDGKNYYFVICGSAQGGVQGYSDSQLEYGRDSLKNPVFKDYLSIELSKKKSYLSRPMTAESASALKAQIQKMEEVQKLDT